MPQPSDVQCDRCRRSSPRPTDNDGRILGLPSGWADLVIEGFVGKVLGMSTVMDMGVVCPDCQAPDLRGRIAAIETAKS